MDKSAYHSLKKSNHLKKPTPLVPAIRQAAVIFSCLAKGDHIKLKLTDICNEVGINKSTGYSILRTLISFGFVEKDPVGKTYCLGPGLIFLGQKVLENMDCKKEVDHFLEKLVKETNCTAVFGIIQSGSFYVVSKYEGIHGIGISIQLGYRFPITYGGLGKTIVAFLPKDEREKILTEKRLYFHGNVSQLDIKQLYNEFARCRELGFAQDIGEMYPGINGVAAPIFGPAEKLIGCIFIIGTFLEHLVEEYGLKVAMYAKQISSGFGNDIDKIYQNLANEKL